MKRMRRIGRTVRGLTLTCLALGSAACNTPLDTKGAYEVRLAPAGGRVEAGDTLRLLATVVDLQLQPLPSTDPLTFFSSDESLALVSNDGLVHAKNVGNVTILAKAGAVQGTAIVTILKPRVATLALSDSVLSMALNEVHHVAVTALSAAGLVLVGNSVFWDSSNSSVAKVGLSGDITALTPGTATITASSGVAKTTVLVTVLPTR